MQRNIALDGLKVTLALMVVALHCGFLTDLAPHAAYLLIHGLFRAAVPVFFIINGYFFWQALAPRNPDAGNATPACRDWFYRIVLLYAFWMLFYAVFWLPADTGVPTDGWTRLVVLLFGYYHLWYLPATIGAAALTWLIRHRSAGLMATLALLTLLTGTALQYAFSYHLAGPQLTGLLPDKTMLYRNFLLFGLPYFLCGVLLQRCQLGSRLSPAAIGRLVLLGIGLVLLESYVNYQLTGGKEGFDMLLSLALLCPALFLLANSYLLRGSAPLGRLAAALYFIHPLFIHLLHRYTELKATPLTLAVIPVSLVAALLLLQLNQRLRLLV